MPFQETKRRDNYPNPDPVKAGPTLDTSLDQTLHVKQYNMPPYVDSNDLSTKEELASKFNVLEQPTKNTIPKVD